LLCSTMRSSRFSPLSVLTHERTVYADGSYGRRLYAGCPVSVRPARGDRVRATGVDPGKGARREGDGYERVGSGAGRRRGRGRDAHGHPAVEAVARGGRPHPGGVRGGDQVRGGDGLLRGAGATDPPAGVPGRGGGGTGRGRQDLRDEEGRGGGPGLEDGPGR